ncbi:polysaccharide biosynthesis tyrosine autokinase [uncultured Tateyamaria sp.]|uniref:polysaccharide biosynthesis tyrosine autokinase n=1 Tax=uncultured Tateyamaria sp. TaxID=455651 RepID=UPI00261F1BE4|nr:polysaccharide biosynthesis tyrosine autokinase [uncultured Tateyamaria sp.]
MQYSRHISAGSISPARSQSDGDVIDLGGLASTIWRGKWVICAATAIAILLGGYYAYVLATPIFRSTAVVILETNQEQIIDLQSVVGGLSGDTSEVNSEVEVLRARGLMGEVVDRLDLTQDPEFNRALRPVTLWARTKGLVKSGLGLGGPTFELTPQEQTQQTRDAVISTLLHAVTVRNVPLSLVFQVTVETENPRKSARIADTIVELYILNQVEVKFETTRQATLWLGTRVSELQARLESAEADVSTFRGSTELVSVGGMQALERQIKDVRDRISTASASGTDRQVQSLRAAERDLKQALDRQSEDLITLQQLTREAEATRVLYEYFLTRFNETSAQQGIQQADSRILSDAVVPLFASEPRKPLILAMSGVLGLMLGTGFVVLREMGHNGFRTAQDLEAFAGYAVLGQVPVMPVTGRRDVLRYLSDKPTSAAVEAIRNLRTSIMLSNVDTPPQVILFTSSVPGEGKTTNALALAQNLLGLGKRVLLIEGDIRRRTLHAYFTALPDYGIVSVLNGQKSLAEAVFQSEHFGADILAGEATTTSAADLFASESFRTLMTEARGAYDAIIIDTPPVLVVPDARIIAEQVDAIIFSVQWDKTNETQVEEALRVFHTSGQRVTGLVLSQINPKGMKRYGYELPQTAPYYQS